MTNGVLTVGLEAQKVPADVKTAGREGLRLLARGTNKGSVFVGVTGKVTAETGNLLPAGPPATSRVYKVPALHFTGGEVWVVADREGQLLDWNSD